MVGDPVFWMIMQEACAETQGSCDAEEGRMPERLFTSRTGVREVADRCMLIYDTREMRVQKRVEMKIQMGSAVYICEDGK
jgi:hypothetical protein